ncbi:MAG TPA: NUDIX hydrolase [Dehalococcoidia bacterium]
MGRARRTYRFCPRCGAALAYLRRPGDRRERPVCSGCGYVFYQHSRVAVGGLVERDGRVLLARRRYAPYRGWWDVPGGFLEEGEHPEDGIRRELREETGLTVRPVRLLAILMDRAAYDGVTYYLLNLFYALEVVGGGEPQPADDVTELRWFSRAELPDRVAFRSCREVVRRWRQGT